jgi:aspartyl-tRNA(Asn)/glutamyl-tRNA(Gln) amidotransferase subunit B
MSDYEAVIGLEVHAQLSTESKIFCGCRNKFGAAPNSNTCPVCLGLPGALPVLNSTALDYGIKMGLATNCFIAHRSVFARKNYFYPDLPKGYQISQYEHPICQNGRVEIEFEGKKRTIRINRIHLEEDAGKSVHDEEYVDPHTSLIDLNRCGTPLIEIVSEPDLRHPGEAVAYLKLLRQILLYLNICDGNMEEGSLRCDANISTRPVGAKTLGTKTELKNMNSFRNVERAVMFEIERQIRMRENGEEIEQATLLWDADRNEARIMRSKEEAHDYRYFPEPDLVPFDVSESYISKLRKLIPELPRERRLRFQQQFGLPEYDADILTATKELADYFESVVKIINQPKLVSNWIMGDILRWINEHNSKIDNFPVRPDRIAELLNLLNRDAINQNAAKTIFQTMLTDPATPGELVDRLQLRQVSDDKLIENIILQVLEENPEEVSAYRNGKEKLIGFFMGQVMRASKGKANPQVITKILQEKLNAN